MLFFMGRMIEMSNPYTYIADAGRFLSMVLYDISLWFSMLIIFCVRILESTPLAYKMSILGINELYSRGFAVGKPHPVLLSKEILPV